MDDLFKIVILALVQGITEFLPISSSGHLSILKTFLDINSDGALIEVVLHAGTLMSILLFYRKRLSKIFKKILNKDEESLRFFSFVIVAIIPIGIIGFIFGDSIEYLFNNTKLVCLFLIITGIFLIFSNFWRSKTSSFNIRKSFLIGLAQMFAILPGMSRSGLTIGMGNIIGIDAKKSAEFSFIIAIPVLTGVIVKYFLNLDWDSISISINYLFLGLIISFITGLLSLRWLISLLEKGKFWYFGLYCIFIGLISLLFFY